MCFRENNCHIQYTVFSIVVKSTERYQEAILGAYFPVWLANSKQKKTKTKIHNENKTTEKQRSPCIILKYSLLR